jgi:CheY-like chemotaxis protein
MNGRKAPAESSSRVRLASVSGQTLEGRLVNPGDRFGPGGRSLYDGASSAVELLLPGGRGDTYVALVDLANLRDLGPRRKALQLGGKGALDLPARQVDRLLRWANDPDSIDDGLHGIVAADEDRRGRIAAALATLDLTVEAVTDGRRALGSARLRRPDLLVVTSKLPGIDGYQVVRHVRAASRAGQTQIVLIQDEGEDASRADAVGADARVEWPSGAERITALAGQLLELV